jgi:hypothetical protein
MGNTFPGFEASVVTTGVVHARIHQGLFYSADVIDLALAAAGDLDVLIQTAADVSMHVRFNVVTGGDAQAWLFEGTTFSVAGTPVPSINRNRFSAHTAQAVITEAPTITADGTQLLTGLIPGGKSGQVSGGVRESFEEFIFRTNEVYLLRVRNLAAQPQLADIQVDWYEPLGKIRGPGI